MTISLIPSLSDLDRIPRIPAGTLAYLQQSSRNRLHALILKEFMRREAEGTLTRTELAHRIDRKKEQVSRWLGAPGNWTVDTASDLLAGMGLVLEYAVRPAGPVMDDGTVVQDKPEIDARANQRAAQPEPHRPQEVADLLAFLAQKGNRSPQARKAA